jgi:HPt (histidine-containing phosphotransfer) domain-containing protein
MTANAMQGDRELCEAAGMDDYVAKPIRVEELVTALERCPWRSETGPRGVSVLGVAPAGAPSEARTAGLPHELRGEARPPAGLEAAPAVEVIDRAVFERLTATMGKGFVAELIGTFVEDGRELLAALRRALAETDIDAFRRAAHSLKSNGESLGATSLAAQARELEAMARAGSVAGVGDRLEPLSTAYERAAVELQRGLSA